MTASLKNLRLIFPFFFAALILIPCRLNAQTVISCSVGGSEFKGKIEEAAQVNIGNENFIQIKSSEGDHILYLYIKLSEIKDSVPVTLSNKGHDVEKGEMPDAEVVWVPDGPDNPQWNTVDGSLTITQFDQEVKTISGVFEFTAEKFVYRSKANAERPSVDLKNGRFDSLQYKVEEK